jgi:hypothetical protein
MERVSRQRLGAFFACRSLNDRHPHDSKNVRDFGGLAGIRTDRDGEQTMAHNPCPFENGCNGECLSATEALKEFRHSGETAINRSCPFELGRLTSHVENSSVHDEWS